MRVKEKTDISLVINIVCLFILAAVLLIHYSRFIPLTLDYSIIIIISYLATLPVLISALQALKNKKISVDLLASIALIASLISQQWLSVIFISLMIFSARIFTDFTQTRSRQAIASLLKLKPRKVKIKEDGRFRKIPLERVKKEDLVVVAIGERIPVDGIVEDGKAEVDQSSLTGESVPVFRGVGDTVLSSTIVTTGNLVIRAEKVGQETTFEKIINLVERSQNNKASISVLSDRFSAWYIVVTLIVSLLLYAFFRNLNLVLAVLLVSCADDLAIAIPLAFLCSIIHGARHGAVIKGGNFIEGLAKTNVAAVDKTGTLTKGKLKVGKIFTFGHKTEWEILKLAGTIYSRSSHISARAIVEYAKEKKIDLEEPEKFEEYLGKGVKAVYENETFFIGKISFFKELNIKITDLQWATISREEDRGFSVTLIGDNDRALGFITLADELRPEASAMVSELKELGIEKIIMLTGDNEKIAQRIADQVGIKEFYANLLPEDKLKYLKKYLGEKYVTAMVGDGVNDAAILALANIGIAMGAIGSDAAIEAADIALMRDDLTQVPALIKIGQSTMKVVHQDLWIWGIINMLGLILVFTGILTPVSAAAYNFVTDFFPLFNSLRLLR